jgi:hypothetical protein
MSAPVTQKPTVVTATPIQQQDFKGAPRSLGSSSSSSSSSSSTSQVQTVSKIDPKDLKVKFIDQLSSIIIKEICKIFEDEIESMSKMNPLPEGAVQYPFAKDGKIIHCIVLRPSYLLAQHTLSKFVETVSAFPKSQKQFYIELMIATAKKVNTCDDAIALALTFVEKQVSLGQSMYDYSLSEIVKSKVASTVIAAVKKNPKIAQLFQ